MTQSPLQDSKNSHFTHLQDLVDRRVNVLFDRRLENGKQQIVDPAENRAVHFDRHFADADVGLRDIDGMQVT